MGAGGGDYVVVWKPWVSALCSGWWFAATVMAIYLAIFLGTLPGFRYSGPYSTVDEQLNYYQVARNFNQYGFTASAFLHDLSLSSDPELHPFIYNHMPPGPEIVTAFMMKVVGERYRLIRLAFAVIFIAGVGCYVLFVRQLLAQLGLTGAGYAVIFLKPVLVLHAMDHPAYSPFPLFAFLPLVLLDRHYRTGRAAPLWGALALVFVASNYLVYQNLVMAVVAWTLLGMCGVIRFDRRHLVAFALMVVAGIVLHALQSVWFFGGAVFVRETVLALSNRMFGVPTHEALMAFYRGLDLVHHGTHQFDPLRLGYVVLASLRVVGFLCTGVLLALVFSAEAVRLGRVDQAAGTLTIPRNDETRELTSAGRMFLLIGIITGLAISIPLLMFPAYSADYGLSGMNEYFLGMAAVAAYAFMANRVWRWWRSGRFPPLMAPVGLLWVLIALVAVSGMGWLAAGQAKNLKQVVRQGMQPNPDRQLRAIAKELKGRVVMTNVYPTTVGFFTEEAAYGGCERAVFHEDGGVDPNRCHMGAFRGFGRIESVVPTHYVLFRALFTGFTLCHGACLDELEAFVAERHRVVRSNERFVVFELSGPVRFGRQPEGEMVMSQVQSPQADITLGMPAHTRGNR